MTTRLRYGISTGSFKRPGETIIDDIQLLRDSPFEFVELSGGDLRFPNLNKTIRALGLSINSIHAPFHHPISDPDEDVRKEGVKDVIRLMNDALPFIEDVERPLPVVIHPGHHLEKTERSVQLAACLKSLTQILDDPISSRFHLCLENMLSSHFCGRSEDLLRLIDALGGDDVSICLDTSHSVYDSSPIDFFEDIFPFLATTHISDNYHQAHGEFHAIPMTLLHSKVDWPRFFHKISQKVDRVIFELNRPNFLEPDLFLKMAGVSAKQIDRFLAAGAK